MIVPLIILAAAVLGLIMLVWLFGQPPAHMFGYSSACDRCGYMLIDLPNRADGQDAICPECGATLLEREQARCGDRSQRQTALWAGLGTLLASVAVTVLLVQADLHLWMVCVAGLALPGTALFAMLLANAGTRLRARETLFVATATGLLVISGVGFVERGSMFGRLDPDEVFVILFWGVPWSLALSLAGLGIGLLAVAGMRTLRRFAKTRL